MNLVVLVPVGPSTAVEPAQELVDRGKKVVHSIKDGPGTRETENRAFFRSLRS